MTIRVELDRLPPDVVAALERGDSVEFESHGKVAAIARPEAPGTKGGLWLALAELPPMDEDFERDIAKIGEVVHEQGWAWES